MRICIYIFRLTHVLTWETWKGSRRFSAGDREGESVEKFDRIDVSQDQVVWQKIKPSWFCDAPFRGMERRAVRSKRDYCVLELVYVGR